MVVLPSTAADRICEQGHRDLPAPSSQYILVQMLNKAPRFTSSVQVCSANGRSLYRVPRAKASLMCQSGSAHAPESHRPIFLIILMRVAPNTNKPPSTPALRDYCTKSFLYPRRLGDKDRSQATFSLRHIPEADFKRIQAERTDQHVYPV